MTRRQSLTSWSALTLVVLLAFIGMPSLATEATKGYRAKPPLALTETGPLTVAGSDLERYRAEPDCEGSKFDTIKLLLDISDISADTRIHARKPDAFHYGQQAAINYNQVAQVAADKGCSVVARRLWLSVIEKFTGTGYAAQRHYAQIGIDDLRSAAATRSLSLPKPPEASATR